MIEPFALHWIAAVLLESIAYSVPLLIVPDFSLAVSVRRSARLPLQDSTGGFSELTQPGKPIAHALALPR